MRCACWPPRPALTSEATIPATVAKWSLLPALTTSTPRGDGAVALTNVRRPEQMHHLAPRDDVDLRLRAVLGTKLHLEVVDLQKRFPRSCHIQAFARLNGRA